MTEQELRDLVAQVHAGALPRRRFAERLLGLGLAAPMVAALLAAGGAAAAEPALRYRPAKAGGGGTLRLLMWQAPTLLNPHFASGQKDFDAARAFYEPLVYWDADGRPQPVLATEIPSLANGGVSADGRVITWRLKPGVTWHDGTPFGADDVVFTWRYARDPATAAFTAGFYDGFTAEKVDAQTVRYVFDKPTPVWAKSAALQILPRHLFEPYLGARSREAPANLKPVGTGPYRFVSFKPGDLVVGERNPAYHMPARPHFDRIEIKGGGDPVSAARAVLQTGEYDFAWGLQVEDELLRRMEKDSAGRVVYSPGGDTEFIALNAADPNLELDGERSNPRSRHPILGDLAVRQALVLLIDRPAIQAFVYGRGGAATPNILNNPERFNSHHLALTVDAARANALLDGAGWTRGPDGVRQKDGRRLRLLFQTSINPVRQKVQQIVKQAWGRAGVEVEIKAVPASVFFSSDEANPDTLNKFFADLQLYTLGRTPDPDRFMQQFTTAQIARRANKWQGLNNSRWSNAEYDRLFEASTAELDPVKRAALFIRMNDLVCGDAHVIPIVVRQTVTAWGRGIVAPQSAWDGELGLLHDWYRET